jgi:glycosyltransferase involved in cell wall biosynthesis
LRSQYGWFFWQSIRRTVNRLLETFKPDAILGYWAHPDGEAAVGVARFLRVPGVVMVGGTDVLLLTEGRRRRDCILKVLREADAVVTSSADLKAKLVDFGIGADKVHVNYRGLDISLFFPGNKEEARKSLGVPLDARILIWVGRMVPVKGLDVLVDACRRLFIRGPNFRLYLVGDGPLRKVLTLECRRRGLSEIVTFVGSQPHNQLPDWYRAADLTVLPSRSEGLPNVLRESLACGTPFVASRVGGIPEIAEEPANLLVPPNNPQSLAEAIRQKLTQADCAKREFRSTSWGDSADSLVHVIRHLVSIKGQNPQRGEFTPALMIKNS